MAKIYVSSTFIDLQDYRAQVERVIRRMGHEDVAMEYYVAEDKRPVDKCLTDVAACDLYIGIFAWRYGWIPKKNNRKKLSITEMEYRQAEKTNKKILLFLLSDEAPWPRKFMDKDTTAIEKLRNEASEAHGGDQFKSVDELARKVAEAIYKSIPAAVPIPEHNLDSYYQALRKRYSVLALEGLTPPQKEEYLQIQLRSVFVEQNVRESPPPVELPKEVWEKLQRDKDVHPEDLPSGITQDDVSKARDVYFEKPSRPVLDVLTDSHYQQTIILGDPGSGKSTLARYVMLSLIDPSTPLRASPAGDEKLRRAFDGYLPLLIELRTYTGACIEGDCNTFLEFLEFLGKTEGWHLTQAALHNHLKNDGRAIVIFDGLDEIFEPEKREQITRQIVGFANDYPKTRIIVTSRVIGYRRMILTDAGFTHFTLQDLDQKQVETFVNRWYDLAMSDRPDEAKERQERILKSFKESASIRQLAGNPMLLTIMAIIGKHQELPRERWKLYDNAASVLIQHWDVNKHLKMQNVEADFIGEDDKKELLRRLAYRMQSGEGGLAGNYIHREQLQAEFESYLMERYSQAPDRAKVFAEAMIQQFRERNFILSLFGANLYGFVHRAFLEFFCASAFKYKFTETQEIDIEYLKHEVYGKQWEDQSWHEVLRLICGMIDEKWVGKIVDYLIGDLNRFWARELSERLPWNIALAVQCLGEVRNISVIAGPSGRLLESLCMLFENIKRYLHFLHDPVLQTIQSIGQNWPNRSFLVRWLRKNKFTVKSWPVFAEVGRIIGILGKGSEEIHQELLKCAQNPKSKIRGLAPYALAVSWHDDNRTLSILHALGTIDTDADVRDVALSALAEHYPDMHTFELLKSRVLEDEDSMVRNNVVVDIVSYFPKIPGLLSILHNWAATSPHNDVREISLLKLALLAPKDLQTLALFREWAINSPNAAVRSSAAEVLGQYFCEDAQTLPLLRDRTINDSDEEVRSSSIETLCKYFREDVQTLPLLRSRAINDTAGNVRSSAVRRLYQYFSDDNQTLPFLHDRAVNDESPTSKDKKEKWEEYVREIAINAIAEYWPDHPDTLPLLEDRAKNDPTPWLRKRAKELIKELIEKKKQA